MDSLLKVEPGLLLWTIITFVILLLILWKTAWKPIVDVLDSRSKQIKGDIEGAENSRLEAEKVLAQHKEMINNAKNEVKTMIADGKAGAEKVKNELIENARKEASEISEKAKNEIEVAKQRAFDELKTEIINISTDIASKIIAKSLEPNDNLKIVEEALDNLGDKKIVQ